ncbi:beta-1,4-N-acetylgalactosaminyltransferase bre-4-like isoform X2 [Pectinophora gossypiella]|uniref:beta-1,4-N-acetylgalactosaminyltransferase bre-4-like isoform X2 n=1 Tax=Pectinophora gossypiella TaxID=13191 RepID=UPI00214E0CB8|nr:beta-1,4-N-acetylgalactosaminyltransferase bre-4-like isoform X2 [Pectinophora gossypiella]
MGGAGGGRAARALRLLLLLVMALAAVEYLFGSILPASPLRTYIYSPLYNATQPTLKTRETSSASWPKRLTDPSATSEVSNITQIAAETRTSTLNETPRIIPTTTTSTKKPLDNSSLIFSKLLEKNQVSTDVGNVTKNSTLMPYCETPSNLGPIDVNKTEIDLASLDLKFPAVKQGGWYSPPNCTAKHRVAIIVPYRDRQQHLAIFLNHMHPFLMKQQVIEYGIFIVEQQGNSEFNRAKLFNVGFVESNKMRDDEWQCFIFHDVDLLPMDERNLYTCPRQPRHMSCAIDKLNYKLPYEQIFGGVSAMTNEQFVKVNGFSNKYWGWGAEDDDMAYRLKKKGYHLSRYKQSIARYTMLDHKKAKPNPKRYKLLYQTKNIAADGLSDLEYTVVEVMKHRLFTFISVNLDESS